MGRAVRPGSGIVERSPPAAGRHPVCSSFTNLGSIGTRWCGTLCIVLVRVAFRGVSMSACAGARAASSSLRFLSAALFLFAAAAAAGAVEPIFVPMDQARMLKIPDRTATLVIGNPLIADVTVSAAPSRSLPPRAMGPPTSSPSTAPASC